MRFILTILVLSQLLLSGYGRSENALPPIVASLALDRKEAFVKEQIQVTLRVGYPPGAFAMTHSKLRVSNAELFSLHKSEVVEYYQNLPYRFIETRYVMFGRAEGEAKVSGIFINATLPVSAGGGGSNPTLEATIAPQSVRVRKMPAQDFPPGTDQWLAASKVTMTSEWPQFEGALNPGVPLTRQIIIKVWGQHPAAVSEKFNLQLPDGVRAYPAPATTTIDKTPDGLNGSVVLPVTLVAGEVGEYELPELSLPWWSIDDKRWHFAILPAEGLDIIVPDGAGLVSLYQRALILLGLLVVGLCFVCFWLWTRPLSSSPVSALVVSEKTAWRQLKKSVVGGSEIEVRNAMLVWSQCHCPNDSNTGLDQFSRQFPLLNELVCTLEKRLYAKDASVDLDRQRLMQALVGVRRDVRCESRRGQVAESLYPQSIK